MSHVLFRKETVIGNYSKRQTLYQSSIILLKLSLHYIFFGTVLTHFQTAEFPLHCAPLWNRAVITVCVQLKASQCL